MLEILRYINMVRSLRHLQPGSTLPATQLAPPVQKCPDTLRRRSDYSQLCEYDCRPSGSNPSQRYFLTMDRIPCIALKGHRHVMEVTSEPLSPCLRHTALR